MVLCMVLGNGRHPEVLKQGQYTCGLHPRLTYLDLTKCLSLCVCVHQFSTAATEECLGVFLFVFACVLSQVFLPGEDREAERLYCLAYRSEGGLLMSWLQLVDIAT